MPLPDPGFVKAVAIDETHHAVAATMNLNYLPYAACRALVWITLMVQFYAQLSSGKWAAAAGH